MYCKKCGIELRDNDEFCYHCGTRTTFMQRMVASKTFIGSIVAVVLVLIVGILTFLILTGKLKFPEKKQEPVTREQEQPAVTQQPIITETPTATPYVFEVRDVTASAKTKMKGLLERIKPFLCYSAPFYADGTHKFKWNDQSATVMALYNLEHVDTVVRYGNDIKTIKKAVKKEMKKLFGNNWKYKLVYGEQYPGYVYRTVGNTIVFNGMRIPGKEYGMKVKKAVEYEQGQYRVVVEAALRDRGTSQGGAVQKYTLFIEKSPDSKYNYFVGNIRLFQKKDMQKK